MTAAAAVRPSHGRADGAGSVEDGTRPVTAPVGSAASAASAASALHAAGRAMRVSMELVRRKGAKAKSRVRMVRNPKESQALLLEVGQGPRGAERERTLCQRLALREVKNDLEEAALFEDAELLREALQDAQELGLGEGEPCVQRALASLQALNSEESGSTGDEGCALAPVDPSRPLTAPSAVGAGRGAPTSSGASRPGFAEIWTASAMAMRPATAGSTASSLPGGNGYFGCYPDYYLSSSLSGMPIWDGGLSRPGTAGTRPGTATVVPALGGGGAPACSEVGHRRRRWGWPWPRQWMQTHATAAVSSPLRSRSRRPSIRAAQVPRRQRSLRVTAWWLVCWTCSTC